MTPNELIRKAQEAAAHAYAPYSDFRVGAALLCDDGSVYVGCNVENASFGLTNCAERTALFSAVADGKKGFRAMAVAASGDQPPVPCGACRQVLAEFCDEDFPVYVAEKEQFSTVTLQELLPLSFKLKDPDA